MRRAGRLGQEWRDVIGEAPPGDRDDAFLARLEAGVRRTERRARRRRLLTRSAAVPAVLVVIALASSLWRRAGDGPETVGETPLAAGPDVSPGDDPVAALMVEAARLRLDGFGDPGQAAPRLEEVVERFAGTRSAIRAAALLESLRGG